MPFKKELIKCADNNKILDKWELSHIAGCE